MTAVSFHALCTASVDVGEVAMALLKPEPEAHDREHLIVQLLIDRIKFSTGKVYQVTIEEIA